MASRRWCSFVLWTEVAGRKKLKSWSYKENKAYDTFFYLIVVSSFYTSRHGCNRYIQNVYFNYLNVGSLLIIIYHFGFKICTIFFSIECELFLPNITSFDCELDLNTFSAP